jgi:hypothetical protein
LHASPARTVDANLKGLAHQYIDKVEHYAGLMDIARERIGISLSSICHLYGSRVEPRAIVKFGVCVVDQAATLLSITLVERM